MAFQDVWGKGHKETQGKGKDAFYGLQTPGYFLTNRLKFGSITTIYGSNDWNMSRIRILYEPEELAV